MIEYIARFFLFFSEDKLIFLLLTLGYIWGNRKIFYDAICIILISTMYNRALKITFQVPLSPMLKKEGFAFPSGHMTVSSALYLWLAFKYQNIFFRVAVLTILTGIGLSLVHFGYHNYYDVVGALFFSILFLVLYYTVSVKTHYQLTFSLTISTFLMLYIGLSHQITEEYWISYYLLLGFALSEKLFGKDTISRSILDKVIASVVFITLSFSLKIVFSKITFFNLPIYLYQLQWGIIGAFLPVSTLLGVRISNLIRKSRKLSCVLYQPNR